MVQILYEVYWTICHWLKSYLNGRHTELLKWKQTKKYNCDTSCGREGNKLWWMQLRSETKSMTSVWWHYLKANLHTTKTRSVPCVWIMLKQDSSLRNVMLCCWQSGFWCFSPSWCLHLIGSSSSVFDQPNCSTTIIFHKMVTTHPPTHQPEDLNPQQHHENIKSCNVKTASTM